jgi:23S rRNA (uracil1939-C5)-methyltransferase
LPDELAAYDAVVVDPPRSGAEAQMKEMARSKIRQIAMVSCSPMTFARDTEILIKAGYQLDWVQVVDQFRWSPHVEVVASLSFGHSET